MSVSSGTINLFAGVAIAMGAAFAGAFALKNPEIVHSLAERYAAFAVPEKSLEMGNAESEPSPSYGEVVLTAGSGGHFETEAEVNGRRIDVMVDTGATLVALTYEDAERAGIFLRPADFTHVAHTANGQARIAPVRIDRIEIGDIVVRNVQGAVGERGAMNKTLLGMSFLSRLSRVDMRAGTLVLAE
jgi:aspartyl protease family protein